MAGAEGARQRRGCRRRVVRARSKDVGSHCREFLFSEENEEFYWKILSSFYLLQVTPTAVLQN